MPKTVKRKRPTKEVEEESENDDSSSSRGSPISSEPVGRTPMKKLLDAVQADIAEKRKKSLDKSIRKAEKKAIDILTEHSHTVNVTRPTELNKILADLHAKLAEKDTLIAHLWDEVAQIDEASQAACKTYAHEMGKVVGAMDDARETTIAAIDEIIAEHQSLGDMINPLNAGTSDVAAARTAKRPRVTDVSLVGSD